MEIRDNGSTCSKHDMPRNKFYRREENKSTITKANHTAMQELCNFTTTQISWQATDIKEER